jgi:hypothetical protein
VWQQEQFVLRNDVDSAEALLAAPHFVVLLSTCTLIGELNHLCKNGICKEVHTTFAWIAPALISLSFDILSLQRVLLFMKDNNGLYILNLYGMLNSIVTIVWCCWVIFQLKGFMYA